MRDFLREQDFMHTSLTSLSFCAILKKENKMYEYRIYKERKKIKSFLFFFVGGGEEWVTHETYLGIVDEAYARTRFNELKQFAENQLPGLVRNFKLLKIEVIA
ncbi:MAG: hypothetical protein HYW78_04210 [Parcubacteria group bacterium]|nr:hypothetical protein [Parcubacteria group bacterium]